MRYSSPERQSWFGRAALMSFAAIAVVGTAALADSALAGARSAEKQGLYEEAIRRYRRVLQKSPSSHEALLGLGRSLAQQGYCREAAEQFSRLPDSKRGLAEKKTLVGTCYFRVRDFPQAIAELKEAARLAPRSKESAIYLARSYAASGRHQEAVASLKSWVAQNGDHVDVLYWIGKFYEGLSEQTAQRMIEMNPGHYLVYQLQGDEYLNKQNYEKALEAYRGALAAAPKLPALHFNLGNVYWRMRKFDEAKKELESELSANPYHAQANYELGDIFVKRGDAGAGIPYLEKALALNPNLVEAHRSLGRAFISEKKYDQAVREFSIVAQADKSDHTIHALLASTYRQMGRLKEAEREARRYEKLVHERMTNLERLKTREKAEEVVSFPNK